MLSEKKEGTQGTIVKIFTHVRNRLKIKERDMIVIKGYGFYQSTGDNSGMGGIWLPFLSISEGKNSEEKMGHIYKPPLAVDKKKGVIKDYFNDDIIEMLILQDVRLRRFGNLEAMLISMAISKQAWIDNFTENPFLKALYKHILQTPSYMEYIKSIQNKNYHLESNTSTEYSTHSLKEMKSLNSDLESAGKKYNTKENFPKDNLKMRQRIKNARFQTQLSHFLDDLSKINEYGNFIAQCKEIINHPLADELIIMKQAVLKVAVGLALLPPKGFHLFSDESKLGKQAVKLLNTSEYTSLESYIKTIALVDSRAPIKYSDLAHFTPKQTVEELQANLKQLEEAIKNKVADNKLIPPPP